MDCINGKWLSNSEYLNNLNRKVMQDRVPVNGSIALTSHCNLKCVHCYLGRCQKLSGNNAGELTTNQWISIIDEIVQAGCLFLLITGGEPFLRKDFSTLYSHAMKSGMLVTVFTNGTLIDKEAIDIFCELPPRLVEISIYGATEKTYERITGTKGALDTCLRGIEMLQAAGIPIGLKTVLMSENLHELPQIKTIAEQYNAKFRFDAAIFPRLDGNSQPLNQRVDPETVAEQELTSPEMRKKWHDFLDKRAPVVPGDRLYNCGSGLTSFHIDSAGCLQPCVLVDYVKYDLREGTFAKGWNKAIPRLRDTRIDNTQKCATCDKRLLCSFCPAFFRLENGSEQIKSDYLCSIGHFRYKILSETRALTR